MTLVAHLPVAGRPKREIIDLAFDDCGVTGIEPPTPDDVASAARKLNAMMLEWPWSALGFDQPSYGVGNLEGGSGIPDAAVTGVAQNLALRIAPSMGLTLSAEFRATASRSLQGIYTLVASVPALEFPPNVPLGAGRDHIGLWGRRYSR